MENPAPTENPAPEATPQETKPAAQPQDRASRKIQELMQRAAAAEAAEKRAQETFPQYRKQVEQELLNQMRSDFGSFAQQHGITTEDLIKQVPEPNPLDPLAQRLEALEAQLLEAKREKETQSQHEVLQSVRGEVHTYVSGNADKFPLTNAAGEQDAVFVRLYAAQQQGQTLSEEDAAREVEESLEKMVKAVLANESVRDRLLGKAEPPAPPPPKKRGLSYSETSQVVATQTPKLSSPTDRIQSMIDWLNQNS